MNAGDLMEEDELREYILACDAKEIMMRRRWTAVPMKRGNGEPWWGVRMADGSDPELKYIVESPSRGMFLDPFVALVEADKWYKANMEIES